MENSHIEWCDHTFNPWIGCTKVSPGCLHCYAETRDERFSGGVHWGKGAPRQRTKTWKEPVGWNKTAICTQCGFAELIGSDDCRKCGRNFAEGNRRRPRVFCASLADWLDEEVPIEWLADLLALIHATPNLDWLLLTKRPENWRTRIGLAHDSMEAGEERAWISRWVGSAALDVPPQPPSNVWIGVSVEDQKRADERREQLKSIPAPVRFVSYEPSLQVVDWTGWEWIDWLICGGESGPGARQMPNDAPYVAKALCAVHGVPFFMKQMGGTRDKKGAIESIPEPLRIRQFPMSNL